MLEAKSQVQYGCKEHIWCKRNGKSGKEKLWVVLLKGQSCGLKHSLPVYYKSFIKWNMYFLVI